MSTASVTAAGSLLMVAAAAFAVAALLTPAPLAPRILPWVEPGWRLQPSRLRGTQITVASFRVASRRHVPEACAAAMVFVCASALADVTSEQLRSKGEGSDSAKTHVHALPHEVATSVDLALQPTPSGLERLSALAGRSACAPLRQLVDAVNTSAALGTPLADVLFAQAQQLRAVHQQQLLAISGKREVLMLIPIVFVIFPVVVAVALFPAWAQLNGSVW